MVPSPLLGSWAPERWAKPVVGFFDLESRLAYTAWLWTGIMAIPLSQDEKFAPM